jgi:cyclophilin family peptidyl-prolyl cis-trans isomerase
MRCATRPTPARAAARPVRAAASSPTSNPAPAAPRRALLGALAAAALAPARRASAADPAVAAPAAATPKITQKAFLDLTYGDGSPAGRLVLGLYGEAAPRAVANFAAFCAGQGTPKNRSYANTPVHRVVAGFVLQGGDVINGNGTGTTSIFGPTFADEPAALALPFDRPGRLAMANRGPDTNGSQWFVTTNENGAAFLNGKYVLFGEVLEGLADAQRLQSLEVDFFSKPKRGLTVAKAGLIE